jgi:hypothetical protein
MKKEDDGMDRGWRVRNGMRRVEKGGKGGKGGKGRKGGKGGKGGKGVIDTMNGLVLTVMEEGGIGRRLPLVPWRDSGVLAGFAIRHNVHFAIVCCLS